MQAIDYAIVIAYLSIIAVIGLRYRKFNSSLESYYLGDRRISWWPLGLSGCSSYIHVSDLSALVSLMYLTGARSLWITHFFWGWITIAFYMAYQGTWIRRVGARTFPEMVQIRFGASRQANLAALVTALFLLVLLVFNLAYVCIGVGKFVSVFWPQHRTLVLAALFGSVAFYVLGAGLRAVVVADMVQALMIVCGSMVVAFLARDAGESLYRSTEWSARLQIIPTWSEVAKPVFHGASISDGWSAMMPLLLANLPWLALRVAAGPNVWDFHFFCAAKSSRDAALAGALWTITNASRWVLAAAVLALGASVKGRSLSFDSEQLFSQVMQGLPIGFRGLMVAVLLAAVMSTLDVLVHLTGMTVSLDLLPRLNRKRWDDRQLLSFGRVVSALGLATGFWFAGQTGSVVFIWETMIFDVVPIILPASVLIWHWRRFGPKAFIASTVASFVLVVAKHVLNGVIGQQISVSACMLVAIGVSVAFGFILEPTSNEAADSFFRRVRPFGWWGPSLRERAKWEGLLDVANGLMCTGLQIVISLIGFFYVFGKADVLRWATATMACLCVTLYFSWYRRLPKRE
jgi:SSS family solute:Na+ symporter